MLIAIGIQPNFSPFFMLFSWSVRFIYYLCGVYAPKCMTLSAYRPYDITLINQLNMNLLSILTWFNSLESLLQTFWGIAIFFSLFFLIQNVMTLVGLSAHDGVDGLDGMDGLDGADGLDGDTLDAGGALQLFTIRNLVNFMLGVGWGGVCFYNYVDNPLLLSLVALICGLAFLFIFWFIWRQMLRLERNGNVRISDSVGQVCSVYLRIPAGRTGMGKVQVSFAGSVQELDAMTDASEMISSGSKVRIVEVIDSSSVLVVPLA